MVARAQTADLLKGIAVLLMMQVHIIELFASNSIFYSNIGKILLFLGGPPVAPVFMVIFGYFVMTSKSSSRQLIIRGVKFIALGFFLNIALNLNLIISVAKGLYQVDLLPYIFGVDILQFAGISILFIVVFKKALEESFVFVIGGIIISSLLGRLLLDYVPDNVLLKYISALFYGSCNWSYFPLFPWLSYPLSGIAFYRISQRYGFRAMCTEKSRILPAVLYILFFIFTAGYAVFISADLPLYYHHDIVFFIWVILFLLFYSFFINELNNAFSGAFLFKYLKWLGRNVTLIYIVQWVIIGNIATEIYKTISVPLYLLFCFLAIVFISSCLSYSLIWLKQQLAVKS